MSGFLAPSPRKRDAVEPRTYAIAVRSRHIKASPVEAQLALIEATFTFNHMTTHEREDWIRKYLPRTYALLAMHANWNDLTQREEAR